MDCVKGDDTMTCEEPVFARLVFGEAVVGDCCFCCTAPCGDKSELMSIAFSSGSFLPWLPLFLQFLDYANGNRSYRTLDNYTHSSTSRSK